MKKITYQLVVLFIISIALFSCQSTVEIAKRRYSSGYYIAHHHPSKQRVKIVSGPENTIQPVPVVTQPSVLSEEPVQELNPEIVRIPLTRIHSGDDCLVSKSTPDLKKPSLSKASRQELIRLRSELKKTVSQERKQTHPQKKNKKDKNVDENILLYVVLAILLPPVAVGLYKGWKSTEFLIDLILWLLGIGIFGFFGFFYLGWLAALIYALIVILS